MSTRTEARSRRELEEERDSLLAALEALDGELADGDIEPAEYDALKDDYTARAAAVIRAIEAVGPGPSGAAAESRPEEDASRAASHGRKRARLGVGILAAVAMVAVAGVLVSRSADQRRPGEAATGEIAATGPTTQVAADLQRARQLTGEGQTLAAIKLYDEILVRDPRQPEALAYRGWLVRLAGRQAGNPQLMDNGLEYLNQAVAADPRYPDAHFFRGLMLYQDKGDAAAAIPELRAFLAAGPPPEMVGLVEDVLRRAEDDARSAR